LIYGDILTADADRDNTLYDLDFCRSVNHLTPHIRKFQNNFMMTFSIRIKGGSDATTKIFFGSRDELIVSRREFTSPIVHTEFITTKGKYLFTQYYDTSPMCTIAKIN
jgi:hypothetical protein